MPFAIHLYSHIATLNYQSILLKQEHISYPTIRNGVRKGAGVECCQRLTRLGYYLAQGLASWYSIQYNCHGTITNNSQAAC